MPGNVHNQSRSSGMSRQNTRIPDDHVYDDDDDDDDDDADDDAHLEMLEIRAEFCQIGDWSGPVAEGESAISKNY